MSEKRFNTDELVNIFNNHSVDRPYYFGFDVVNAIIARLRAADKLCTTAKKMGYHGGDFETLTHGFLERPINVKSNDDLRKAIAGYEGKK
jgi:hypothetical protein